MRAHQGDGAAARDSERRRALGELCEMYWRPVYHFLRQLGHSDDEAMDLCQGFMLKLLDRGNVGSPNHSLGRFRTYLLSAVKNYRRDEWDRAKAQKRGGGCVVVPLESTPTDHTANAEPAEHQTPETIYLKAWAQTLLEAALKSLEARYERDGRATLFANLLPMITDERPLTFAQLAEKMGTSEAALKMAATRMRKRFREALRNEVRQTVADESEVNDELRFLIAALEK